MSTMSGYRSGYYDDEYDDRMSPGMQREVARLARQTVLWRLRTAWLATVLLLSLVAVLATALLHASGLTLPGLGCAIAACLGLLQLFAASLRKRRDS